MKKDRHIAAYIILSLGALLMILPFFWMILSSLKTAAEVNTTPPTFLPEDPTLENYIYAFQKAPFARYFLNSVLVTALCVAFTMFTTILAAFAFSRLKFPGRDVIFSALLALMMIPFEMLIITNYQTIVKWDLIDNLWALVLPFTSSIFYTYVLRNFFLSIPDSLYHSARVDGASNWFYLWRIMVPISKPALATIGLLDAITCWNAFLWTVLVTNKAETRTLPFGLYAFMSSSGIRYERLMAAATIVVLPMIILFICFRKQIVTGVSRGGLKG
ncbi:MAG: carbohydrate ABC transporter permease [Sphaerochaetaceae bacterium]|jgi:multiple sugar transport system permease protein|nr:carbohydrate ABC transporter permease [Sphaerochaetaceae bacterium]